MMMHQEGEEAGGGVPMYGAEMYGPDGHAMMGFGMGRSMAQGEYLPEQSDYPVHGFSPTGGYGYMPPLPVQPMMAGGNVPGFSQMAAPAQGIRVLYGTEHLNMMMPKGGGGDQMLYMRHVPASSAEGADPASSQMMTPNPPTPSPQRTSHSGPGVVPPPDPAMGGGGMVAMMPPFPAMVPPALAVAPMAPHMQHAAPVPMAPVPVVMAPHMGMYPALPPGQPPMLQGYMMMAPTAGLAYCP